MLSSFGVIVQHGIAIIPEILMVSELLCGDAKDSPGMKSIAAVRMWKTCLCINILNPCTIIKLNKLSFLYEYTCTKLSFN